MELAAPALVMDLLVLVPTSPHSGASLGCTQRGLPLYAVLSPHWIKVVGYKESFLLGSEQSRVTDRPVFQTKHSIEVIAVGRYNYLRLILTQIYHLLLL